MRVIPNFVWGNGIFGPIQTVQVSGTSASLMLNVHERLQEDRMDLLENTALLYPITNAADRFMLNIAGADERPVVVSIYDNPGKRVHSEQFMAEGQMIREVVLGGALSSGLYTVEIQMSDIILTERMVVSNR